jgi:hypothetical protein
MAAEHGRPFQYLNAPTRKEDLARKMAEEEGIKRGLICVYAAVELCWHFHSGLKKGSRWYGPPAGNAFLFTFASWIRNSA